MLLHAPEILTVQFNVQAGVAAGLVAWCAPACLVTIKQEQTNSAKCVLEVTAGISSPWQDQPTRGRVTVPVEVAMTITVFDPRTGKSVTITISDDIPPSKLNRRLAAQ